MKPLSPDEAAKRLSDIAKKLGKAGGEARAKKLTQEERSEISRRAAIARWEKARKASSLAVSSESVYTSDMSKLEAARVLGRSGGIARAKSLSKERRSEIARAAALKRWKKEEK